MLTIVCWKWKRSGLGFQLPNIIEYTEKHVNTLKSMLDRHLRIPFRLVCMTDDPTGIECETLPIPTRYAELGGCYRRLWIFSEEARSLLGDRIASIDLDCVIVGDCTEIFSRPEEFIVNSYNPLKVGENDQFYNGALMLFDAGSRRQLWDDFCPERTPDLLRKHSKRKVCIGSDQAWIRICLGKEEARFSNDDGVFEARQVGKLLPKKAKIIFFAGRRDPSLDKRHWVRLHWR